MNGPSLGRLSFRRARGTSSGRRAENDALSFTGDASVKGRQSNRTVLAVRWAYVGREPLELWDWPTACTGLIPYGPNRIWPRTGYPMGVTPETVRGGRSDWCWCGRSPGGCERSEDERAELVGVGHGDMDEEVVGPGDMVIGDDFGNGVQMIGEGGDSVCGMEAQAYGDHRLEATPDGGGADVSVEPADHAAALEALGPGEAR